MVHGPIGDRTGAAKAIVSFGRLAPAEESRARVLSGSPVPSPMAIRRRTTQPAYEPLLTLAGSAAASAANSPAASAAVRGREIRRARTLTIPPSSAIPRQPSTMTVDDAFSIDRPAPVSRTTSAQRTAPPATRLEMTEPSRTPGTAPPWGGP